jgi:hypothetical protein
MATMIAGVFAVLHGIFLAAPGIPKASAHRVLKGLTGKGILTVSREGKGKSPTIYRFSRLIAITETSNW